MSADVTKVFIEGMEACTDEQRAEIEVALREHNAEAMSKEEYMKHLQESALQEERQMQELRDKMQDYHLYRKPEIVAAPRIDLNPQPFYTKFLNKRKKPNKRK